ncbi:hypothetical protein P168DRAFT_18333 [Aspergillus campestris IBT 28561]|uniref:Uncharacterized protein n=1 Tax=Aspergillus campestris (strain IBT 28561) TaxID=1392248 RepID=A0A2I1DF87_ASPC2|nr:uncharacterized protein P168DRAFT_18333 [Aspergillus campestris IBT 28561]PKY08542.1 hypothetical protein P168DRAFT_18333 [Aspergillus campestris IBT 28561]
MLSWWLESIQSLPASPSSVAYLAASRCFDPSPSLPQVPGIYCLRWFLSCLISILRMRASSPVWDHPKNVQNTGKNVAVVVSIHLSGVIDLLTIAVAILPKPYFHLEPHTARIPYLCPPGYPRVTELTRLIIGIALEASIAPSKDFLVR